MGTSNSKNYYMNNQTYTQIFYGHKYLSNFNLHTSFRNIYIKSFQRSSNDKILRKRHVHILKNNYSTLHLFKIYFNDLGLY